MNLIDIGPSTIDARKLVCVLWLDRVVCLVDGTRITLTPEQVAALR